MADIFELRKMQNVIKYIPQVSRDQTLFQLLIAYRLPKIHLTARGDLYIAL